MKIYKKIVIAIILSLLSATLIATIIVGEVYPIVAVSSLSGVALGWLIPKNIEKVQDCLDTKKWQPSMRKLWRGKILKKDSLIRISFAYLFRIKVDGKYFLVKNGRGTQKFQPVGGAYKTTEKEKTFLKDLKKFIQHFDITVEREHVSDLSREFIEEMIKTQIVDFTEIKYRYCGRHFTEVLYSRYFQCYELLMADVVEILLTKEQEKKLRSLMPEKSNNYYFATADEIKSLGVDGKRKKMHDYISDHSEKILQETEYELENKGTSKETFSINL